MGEHWFINANYGGNLFDAFKLCYGLRLNVDEGEVIAIHFKLVFKDNDVVPLTVSAAKPNNVVFNVESPFASNLVFAFNCLMSVPGKVFVPNFVSVSVVAGFSVTAGYRLPLAE